MDVNFLDNLARMEPIRTDSWLANFSIPMKSIIKAVNILAKGRLFTEIKQDVNISGPVFVR